jgi:hypothetical protein
MSDKLKKLVTEWARAEISSRFAQFVKPGMSEHVLSELRNKWWQEKLEYEDKLREAVFGTDCFVGIAEKLGLFKAPDPKENKKRRRNRAKKKKLKVGRRAMK